MTAERLASCLNEVLLVDIRDESAYSYGHIEGAVHNLSEFPQEKQIVFYCRNGAQSANMAEELCAQGYDATFLEGGYVAWLNRHIDNLGEDCAKRVEQSIRTTYHKRLFSKFARAIVTYNLIQPNDKIAVCISGGKDSMLLAKLFQEIKRHNKFAFELVFLVMDPGYSRENRALIEKNAKSLDIPVTVFETDIFDNVFTVEKSPCYLCARMRRGHLYSQAKALGCNKIALGHHYDDVIETILMGMLYGGQVQTMMPKLKSSNFEGMELIRPMYFIREADIKAWRNYNNLQFLQCACRFTEECSKGCESSATSKRQKVKELIRELSKDDPEIEQNIFKSVENVNLSTLIAYKDKQGVKHFFDEDY